MPPKRASVLLVSRSLILKEDGELLLIKRSSSDRHFPSLWECPGGKVDSGEKLTESGRREVFEETGLLIDVLNPNFFTDSRVIDDKSEYDGETYIAIFTLSRLSGGSLTLSDEHEDHVWVECADAFRYDLTPEVRKALHHLFLFQNRE